MRLKRTAPVALAGLALLLCPGGLTSLLTPPAVRAEGEPRPAPTRQIQTTEEEALKTFMAIKLKSSQEILAGLTSENFKAVEQGGQDLINMSLASTWQVYETPTYKKDSQTFREQATELVKAAKEKKLDQCTESYFKVIRSCVKCHETVRKSKIAGFPAPQTPGHHPAG